MSERVDIANVALSMLGADPITGFEDETREAQLMRIHYPLARDATLEAHEWTFATVRFKPSKLEAEPTWGYGSAFEIPANVIRVIDVERGWAASTASWTDDTSVRRNQAVYQEEGRKILCDYDEIYIRAIIRPEGEGVYTPSFAHALAAKIATLTAYALTESNSKVQAMATLYAGLIQEAKTRDGQKGTTRRLRQTSTIRAR